ncbi:MAG TPA: sigma-70 family RNA polymerase sigma factor [Verrucomicrobiae bacterium]|nr:sigma-70 family RNA polymerase sigma factor [Verrucomicrobiae bacterium]
MRDTDVELLSRYSQQNVEDAFTELVRRHLGLVYSAAVRQVRSPQLAEEVAQSVFLDLARSAGRLKSDTVLSAWLYQVTHRTAIDVVRRETRRQLREQIATQMNALNAAAADWTNIEPLLDEAMHALNDTDRTAVLLRYFENKSLREVGSRLGMSENAAQKRLCRALERLRDFFAKRGVTVATSGLVVSISANAIQAAPIGLVVTISSTAALAGASLATTATSTATKALAMTATQKLLIAATLVAAVSTGLYESHRASALRSKLKLLQAQMEGAADPNKSPRTTESDESERELAALRADNKRLNVTSAELQKLQAEITGLRNQARDLTQQKTSDLQRENAALRDKTNQLWQSLVDYINSYSNSIPAENRWAYSLAERNRFSLAQLEDGSYSLRRKGGDGTQRDFFGGRFTSIGIGENHIFVHTAPFKDAAEGWRIIDLRCGAVNGPYADTEFMIRPEVRGVTFMKPEEAWALMK